MCEKHGYFNYAARIGLLLKTNFFLLNMPCLLFVDYILLLSFEKKNLFPVKQ